MKGTISSPTSDMYLWIGGISDNKCNCKLAKLNFYYDYGDSINDFDEIGIHPSGIKTIYY